MSEPSPDYRLTLGACPRHDSADGLCGGCVDELVERRVGLAIDASPSTLKQYALTYRGFARWCAHNDVSVVVDADRVRGYLVARLEAGITPRTVAHDYACLRALASHLTGDSLRMSTELRTLLKSLSKRRHDTPLSHARPIKVDDLTSICRRPTTHTRLQHHRDTAIILVGWSIGARPQDIAALRWRDIRLANGVITVSVPAGKTAARQAYILPSREAERCPVAALRRWAAAMGVDVDDVDVEALDRPVFARIDRWGNYRRSVGLSSEAVSDIVRQVAVSAGLGPGYAGGSLRSGFVSSASEAGIDDRDIMAVTGHRSLASLQRYRREIAAFSNPALKLL